MNSRSQVAVGWDLDWSSQGGPPAAHCRTPPWVNMLPLAYALHPLPCSCAPESLPKAKSLSPSSIFRGTWVRMFSRSDVTSAPSSEEGCRDQVGGQNYSAGSQKSRKDEGGWPSMLEPALQC